MVFRRSDLHRRRAARTSMHFRGSQLRRSKTPATRALHGTLMNKLLCSARSCDRLATVNEKGVPFCSEHARAAHSAGKSRLARRDRGEGAHRWKREETSQEKIT